MGSRDPGVIPWLHGRRRWSKTVFAGFVEVVSERQLAATKNQHA